MKSINSLSKNQCAYAISLWTQVVKGERNIYDFIDFCELNEICSSDASVYFDNLINIEIKH